MAWKENPCKWRRLIYCNFLAMGPVLHALGLGGHGQRCPIPIPALGSCPAEYCHSRGPMIMRNGLPLDLHSALSLTSWLSHNGGGGCLCLGCWRPEPQRGAPGGSLSSSLCLAQSQQLWGSLEMLATSSLGSPGSSRWHGS